MSAVPRRRCWWCGITLRWWQPNSCRPCKRALVYAASPPFPQGSRWADPGADTPGGTDG